MPMTPKGGKRPADVTWNVVHVMFIASGEIEDDAPVGDGKYRAAVALGKRRWRSLVAKLSPEARAEIARKVAAKRWGKN